MGTTCASLIADLFLFCYERDVMLSLSDNNQNDVIEAFLSREESKDQESIQSSATPDLGYLMGSDKYTIKHHIQESQEISPDPAGDHKAAWHRQGNIVKTNTK